MLWVFNFDVDCMWVKFVVVVNDLGFCMMLVVCGVKFDGDEESLLEDFVEFECDVGDDVNM